ncbi:MAG: TlpA family protein disulfide reductase [Bacteroidales bacterium]|nr:TlpA family protein disulfide reductase [Bacteroidales bacterium]
MKNTAIIFVLLLSGCLYCTAQNVPSVEVKDLNGNPVNTSNLSNGGKPYIISFFALWCKPSLKELDEIQKVYSEWQRETGVKIYIVSTDEEDNSSKVRSTINEHGWNYKTLMDPDGKFKEALNINLMPAVFVVDSNGKIVFSRTGYTDGAESQLLAEVRKITLQN